MSWLTETLADSPALFWKLDETLFGDSGSNGVGFTPGSGLTLSKTALLSDGGAAVAGSGSDYIAHLGSLPASINGNNASGTAWVKIPPSGSMQGAFFNVGAGNNGWAVGIGNTTMANAGSNLILLVGNVNWFVTGYTFTPGVHHVAAVRGAAGAITIYVDGTSVYTSTQSFVTATSLVSVGSINLGTYLTANIDVDNVALFASALASGRVTAHYAGGSGSNAAVAADSPVIWLKLDEPSASNTTALDSSGNARHGTHIGGVTLRQASLLADLTGFSAAYDGTNDYTAIAYSSWMNGSVLEVEARIRPDATMLTGQQFIGSRWGASGQRTFLFSLNGGKVEASIINTSAATVTVQGATTLTAGGDYTVTLRQNGSTLQVFLNGVSDGSIASTTPMAQPTAGDIEIGRAASAVYSHVRVDEFTYKLSASSDARILARHNAAAGVLAPHVVAVGTATETDAAQPIARRKARTLGVATETDAAQSIDRFLPYIVHTAAETEVALPVVPRHARPATTAAETDTALPLAHYKRVSLGLAAETDTARPVTYLHVLSGTVNVALETDTAGAITLKVIYGTEPGDGGGIECDGIGYLDIAPPVKFPSAHLTVERKPITSFILPAPTLVDGRPQ